MPVDNNSPLAKPGSRLRELGLVLPQAPSPLGGYVEVSQVGSLQKHRAGSSEIERHRARTENRKLVVNLH